MDYFDLVQTDIQVDPVYGPLAQALEAHIRAATQGSMPSARLLDSIRAGLLAGQQTLPPLAPHRQTLSQRTIRKVEEYVQQNLARDFCVQDIARAACVSPYHLARNFRRATGQSLWQYVLRSRAALACSLIVRRPTEPLADIAGLSGFSCYAQFVAAFRKVYGVTPGNYRRGVDAAAPDRH